MDDEVQSDIHLKISASSSTTITRFSFRRRAVGVGRPGRVEVDDDGDLVLDRTADNDFALHIEHFASTSLDDVGGQVWPGALLMADYMINLLRSSSPSRTSIIELGCGVGLTALAIASTGASVVATDRDESVLRLVHKNIKANGGGGVIDGLLTARPFDWRSTDMSEWREELRDCQFIIVADGIYDEELNELLFDTIDRCWQVNGEITVIFAVDQRLNFDARQLRVCCTAFDHFVSWCRRPNHAVTTVDLCHVPQLCDSYDRTEFMQIVRVNAINSKE